MSNERKNRVDDPLVADTYTALAQERAPDHLNKRVLRMAAREGRTRYSRARAWMRPAAWAATIGLSLALVLELTRLPQIEPETANITVPKKELADKNDNDAKQTVPAAESQDPVSMDAFAPKDMAVLREADERARAQAGPDQVPATPRVDAGTAPDEDAPARRVTADENIPAKNATVDRDSAEHVSAKRLAAETASGAASLAVAAEEKALTSGFACPAKVRESAESWLACIKQLRESGQEDLADSEYDEFQRNFPNFADADADK
ncbi:MAG: hypothetical protein OEO71_05035 [Gammaproteobacteria bacterium]|nr:hypothetical protein [Gammaproteobacteria bacterium]